MTLEQAIQLSLSHSQAGQLAEAISVCRQILDAAPDHPQALHLYGVLQDQAGQHQLAEQCIRKSIALDPQNPASHMNLGTALRNQRRFAEAAQSIKNAIALKPQYPEAFNNLGLTLRDLGDLHAAVECYKNAITLNPGFIHAINNLGVTLRELGMHNEAIVQFKKALSINPDFSDALNNLGLVCHDQGNPLQALHFFEKAASLNPHSPMILANLGHVLSLVGQFDQAIARLRQAIALAPGFASAHNNLGNAYKLLGDFPNALSCFQKAVQLDPAYAMPLINISAIHLIEGRPDQAIQCLKQALSLHSDEALALTNLGNAYADMGRSAEAFEMYRKALDATPPYPPARHNYLYSLNFLESADPKDILNEHLKWDQSLPRIKSLTPREVPVDKRPLRIGFLSPEFRSHPVGRFFLPLVANLDPSLAQTFCYSDCDAPDFLTRQIQQSVSVFKSVGGFSSEILTELIRADDLDILIDLTLHMSGCRLDVFARRPAPIQVSWLGYCGTTGLSEIPWRITDPLLDPPGLFDSHYSEKNAYLPVCYWCYQPMDNTPPIKRIPNSDVVTFGCLNNFCKVRNASLDLWKSILESVPHSKLIFLVPEGSSRQRILDRWKSIDPARVLFVGRQNFNQYLELYSRIDIALDPFPYGGGTTTCDALWMGAPVVTLVGNRAVSRAGLSILSAVGLPELIAHTPQQYIDIARNLANDPGRRLQLSQSLRQRMLASPLMDAKRYAADFAALFQSLVHSSLKIKTA